MIMEAVSFAALFNFSCSINSMKRLPIEAFSFSEFLPTSRHYAMVIKWTAFTMCMPHMSLLLYLTIYPPCHCCAGLLNEYIFL